MVHDRCLCFWNYSRMELSASGAKMAIAGHDKFSRSDGKTVRVRSGVEKFSCQFNLLKLFGFFQRNFDDWRTQLVTAPANPNSPPICSCQTIKSLLVRSRPLLDQRKDDSHGLYRSPDPVVQLRRCNGQIGTVAVGKLPITFLTFGKALRGGDSPPKASSLRCSESWHRRIRRTTTRIRPAFGERGRRSSALGARALRIAGEADDIGLAVLNGQGLIGFVGLVK